MPHVWFSGPVTEAVKSVTDNNMVFLVYLYDDSEESKQLDIVFEDENLVSTMESKTVALKMQKDSNQAKLFGQLYPTYQVPVVYFILQGTIKDYGIHTMKSQDIIAIINKFSLQIDSSKKLQDIRKKRLEQEDKQARASEIKTREQKRLAQETQQSLQDKQTKIHLERAKKERKAAEEYKQKVREQISKDRANQIAARKTEKQRVEKSPSKSNPSSGGGYHNHSNLNIKQLDGSSLRHDFSSSNTLASVIEWIDTVRTDGDMPYKLFAQFPNRHFDIGEEQRTLLELKLCPSGTLIMKPVKNASTAYARVSSSSSNGGWMAYLHSASDAIYKSASQVGTSVANYLVTPTATPEHGQRLGNSGNSAAAGGSNNNTRQPPLRENLSVSNTYKKFDDDNNNNTRQTYNGNSVNHQ